MSSRTLGFQVYYDWWIVLDDNGRLSDEKLVGCALGLLAVFDVENV